MTELPICAAVLAAETGLPERKAETLIEEMRRSGKAVMHSRTWLVFREDVAEFLRERAKYAHAQNAQASDPEPLRDEDHRRREAAEFLQQHNRRSRGKGTRVHRKPKLTVVAGADLG